MELRELRYFLAVAQAGTISAAAEALHVTQPTLSRQLMELENRLGKTLFLRGKRKITLTDEGLFLRGRAREILALVEKTETAFSEPEESIGGEVFIGGGETDAMRILARAARRLHERHPNVIFHLFSGNAEAVAERIARGLVDFGVFIDPADLSEYDVLRLPVRDTWGLLMRRDSPLARKTAICPADLFELPLICSRQAQVDNDIAGWMGSGHENLHIIATYNLLYNAALMVEEGLGYALCLDKIVTAHPQGNLCFRPLAPRLAVGLAVAWKKSQTFSPAAAAFLACLREEIASFREQPGPAAGDAFPQTT